MKRDSLTRRIRLEEEKRYRRKEGEEERKGEGGGEGAQGHDHGHTYTCDVTVTGEIDPVTGMVVDLGRLDAVLAAEVHARFDHRNINLDVPEFADGQLVPTGENLARFIFERVQAALQGSVQVSTVHLAEDESLSATYHGG